MIETPNPAVTISVDLKKYRIRFYKSMLHLLGDPPFIQLLVNPDNKCVAIRGVEKAVPGDQSEKIKPQKLMADNCYELYSMSFVKKLISVAGKLEMNCSYRLTGNIVSSHNMAVFSMKTLTRIEN